MKSFVTRSWIGWRVLIATVCFMTALTQATWANQWSRAVGDAISVQCRTEDIAKRLNKEFSHSQAALIAFQMDNAACQMLEAVKCGASWAQVQSSLHRVCAIANQVNASVNNDCNVRNDRRTRDYLNDLSKRIERLRCNLDKAYAATQPKFCPTPVNVNRPSWSDSYQHVPFAESPYRGVPMNYPRFNTQPNFPRDTYEFDSPRYDDEQLQYAPVPEPVPMNRGPIEYRVQRSNPQRAAAFVQLGLQALQLLSEDR